MTPPWTSTPPSGATTGLSCRGPGRRRELGLPSWWLNKQATSYLPPGEDHESKAVLERPGLTVLAASPRHLLAMKVRAARQSDIADIIVLARLVGAASAEEVRRITAQVLGDHPLSQRSRAVLADLDDILHKP